jgi:Tfp pilus assembly protein PilF
MSKGARSTAVAQREVLARAVAAGNSGNLSEAERIVREILSKTPQHPDALQLLGVLLLGQKRPREAVAPLEEAARNTANPELETHLAVALGKAGRSDDALKWLYRAIERRPVYARAFHELGNLLHATRQYAEAETVLKRGLEAAPTMPELSLALGAVHIDRADSAGAKVAFARVLSMVPGSLDALIGFGIALQYEGEFAGAAERFRRALARDPGHHRARVNLGLCLIELGQIDEGIACLRTAVQGAPYLYGTVLRVLASTGRGRFWLKPSAAAACLGFKA